MKQRTSFRRRVASRVLCAKKKIIKRKYFSISAREQALLTKTGSKLSSRAMAKKNALKANKIHLIEKRIMDLKASEKNAQRELKTQKSVLEARKKRIPVRDKELSNFLRSAHSPGHMSAVNAALVSTRKELRAEQKNLSNLKKKIAIEKESARILARKIGGKKAIN